MEDVGAHGAVAGFVGLAVHAQLAGGGARVGGALAEGLEADALQRLGWNQGVLLHNKIINHAHRCLAAAAASGTSAE